MSDIESDKTLHLDCRCLSAEHIIRVEPEAWSDDGDVGFSVQLTQLFTFWDRVKAGIRYVFAGTGVVGWDSFILKVEDIPKLIAFLEKQHSLCDKNKIKQ